MRWIFSRFKACKFPCFTSLYSQFHDFKFPDLRRWIPNRTIPSDDELTLLAAKEGPVGMIRGLDRAIIDEIQRAPPLLLAIKKTVDEDRRPGRFLLAYIRFASVYRSFEDSDEFKTLADEVGR